MSGLIEPCSDILSEGDIILWHKDSTNSGEERAVVTGGIVEVDINRRVELARPKAQSIWIVEVKRRCFKGVRNLNEIGMLENNT
jgi:hypothetical protein